MHTPLKLLLLSLSIFFISQTQALAIETFSASATGTVITAVLSGIESSYSTPARVYAKTTPFSNTPTTSLLAGTYDLGSPSVSADGSTKTWISKDFAPKTKYYVRMEKLSDLYPAFEVTTGSKTIDLEPLKYDVSGNLATISGRINNNNVTGYEGKLEYSTEPADVKGTVEAPLHVPAHTKTGTGANNGINSDGSYVFELSGLAPKTVYYIRQTITSPNGGGSAITNDKFNSTDGYKLAGSQDDINDFNKRSYRLLAQIPGLGVVLDQDLCLEQAKEGNGTAEDCNNQIGNFINLLIKIMIGISAVVLVVQLIIQGYTYMVTDVPFLMAGAKSRFFEAFFGLLLALSAYLILNTINPKLVSGGLSIDRLDIGVIKSFDISGARSSSFSGTPIKVDFNKEAYPAAKIAHDKTGVSTSFILAIFAQETGSGSNVGKCKWTDPKSNMYSSDKTALQTITTELVKNIDDTPVSCALIKNDGSFNGHGGAIGYTQILPTTWLSNRIEAKNYLGHTPSPWNTGDALMVTAVYLKKNGGLNNEQEAACKYYAGPGRSCSFNADVTRYGKQVMGKKISIEKQIADSIRKGEID